MLQHRLRIVLLTCGVTLSGWIVPNAADAGWLQNLLCRWRARRAARVCGYGSACCPQQTCCYVPQTCYRRQIVRVPVTTYRRIQTCDPCTGCPVTVMRPCTSYVRTARLVPYTTYRVVRSNPCCPTTCCPTSCCPTSSCGTSSCGSSPCAGGACPGGACGASTFAGPTTSYSPGTTYAPSSGAPVRSIPTPSSSPNTPSLPATKEPAKATEQPKTFAEPQTNLQPPIPAIPSGGYVAPSGSTTRYYPPTSQPTTAEAKWDYPALKYPTEQPRIRPTPSSQESSPEKPRQWEPRVTANDYVQPAIYRLGGHETRPAGESREQSRPAAASQRLDDGGWRAARPR